MNILSTFIELDTNEGIALHDLMPEIKAVVARSGIKNGFVSVTSQHTTTAINENEARLIEDVKRFLARLTFPHVYGFTGSTEFHAPRVFVYALHSVINTGAVSVCKI